MSSGLAEDRDASRTEGVVDVIRKDGKGPFVLVCEHASNHIPDEFGNLGLEPAALVEHIAWDPGALGVAEVLSDLLDAPLVVQRVSRLLYDCNRPPESPASVPASSEVYAIPGNMGLSDRERADRAERFYHPFRDLLARTIEDRLRHGVQPAIVTVHSFTPVYFGAKRDVEFGVLHDQDSRLADLILGAARADGRMDARRNEPYGPADGVTHTLREHALPRGLPNVMIEIRNDLLSEPSDQRAIAARLADWLADAQPSISGPREREAVR